MSVMVKKPAEGFTLLEVLIAMAITAFVALIATTSLSSDRELFALVYVW